MNREVIWQATDGIGQEHVTVSDRDGVIIADGFGIAMLETPPVRVRYQVLCDAGWMVRGVAITTEVAGGSPTVIEIRTDGNGSWTNSDGSPLPHLDGCVDVDISSTPFTNTLPIRRLSLQPDRSEDIHVTYIDVQSLSIGPSAQRYTGIADCVVRFEALGSGFQRALEIDGDGLVVDYQGLFTRVWSR